MMDTSTCATLVLVLLWLSLCCQALGSFVAWIDEHSINNVLYGTTTISTVLLAVCLWQCHRAGLLVSPMTLYHWVLLALLVLLQIMVVVLALLKQLDPMNDFDRDGERPYPVYSIAAALAVLLGGTLFCGWKCNLFCRPCCKSQYICYGSAVVVVLLIMILVAVTFLLAKTDAGDSRSGQMGKELWLPQYLSKILIFCMQWYSMAVIWITTVRLPYTVPEVVVLVAAAMAVASILAVLICAKQQYQLQYSTRWYVFIAFHLASLGITWYCLEFKKAFHWPKDYMCFGLLAAIVILVAMLGIVIKFTNSKGIYSDVESVKYTLLGYSFLLMVPTLWYAYRCGLLTWRWNSCLPKKKGLKATDNAENTTPDTVIAKES